MKISKGPNREKPKGKVVFGCVRRTTVALDDAKSENMRTVKAPDSDSRCPARLSLGEKEREGRGDMVDMFNPERTKRQNTGRLRQEAWCGRGKATQHITRDGLASQPVIHGET